MQGRMADIQQHFAGNETGKDDFRAHLKIKLLVRLLQST
jgi:hypothetical protein